MKKRRKESEEEENKRKKRKEKPGEMPNIFIDIFLAPGILFCLRA